MDPEFFKRCLVAAFGPGYLMPASAALGIKHRQLQRMVRGQERVYPDTALKLWPLLDAKCNEVNDTLVAYLGWVSTNRQRGQQ